MKRLLLLVVFAAMLFYVAWPAYSAYVIKTALDNNDADTLNARIDFPAVRASLRPAITAKVEATLDAASAKAGPSGAKIYAALKTKFMPKIIEAALDRALTPEALVRINAERGSIKDILDRLVAEQVTKTGGSGLGGLVGAFSQGGALGNGDNASDQSKFDAGKVLGGLFGKKDGGSNEAPAQPPTGKAAPMTWRNIKGYGLDGLTGVHVSVAKDAAASGPDVTARMSFDGTGWLITSAYSRPGWRHCWSLPLPKRLRADRPEVASALAWRLLTAR